MSANGRLLASELAPVPASDGQLLLLAQNTATAFMAMDAASFRATGLHLWASWNAGAYRDWDLQGDIGNKNPNSSVPVAGQGWSTHGWGTRVDIGSWGPGFGADGARRSAWLGKNSGYYGFTREFGERDPNHYAHDGRTKAAWRQYRLDWDEMATKAEIQAASEAAMRKVLNEGLIKSPVSGKNISVLTVLRTAHGNLDDIEVLAKKVDGTVTGIAGALASTPDPATPQS